MARRSITILLAWLIVAASIGAKPVGADAQASELGSPSSASERLYLPTTPQHSRAIGHGARTERQPALVERPLACDTERLSLAAHDRAIDPAPPGHDKRPLPRGAGPDSASPH